MRFGVTATHTAVSFATKDLGREVKMNLILEVPDFTYAQLYRILAVLHLKIYLPKNTDKMLKLDVRI